MHICSRFGVDARVCCQTRTHTSKRLTDQLKPLTTSNPFNKNQTKNSEEVKAQREAQECTFLPAILDAPTVDEGALFVFVFMCISWSLWGVAARGPTWMGCGRVGVSLPS